MPQEELQKAIQQKDAEIIFYSTLIREYEKKQEKITHQEEIQKVNTMILSV